MNLAIVAVLVLVGGVGWALGLWIRGKKREAAEDWKAAAGSIVEYAKLRAEE